MKPEQFPVDKFGFAILVTGAFFAIVAIAGYIWRLVRPQEKAALIFARLSYALSALATLGAFGFLAGKVYLRDYHYKYVFEHTSNDLTNWYRFAATWSGQEGSFALWAACTALIGFLVLWKAGKYEARVMPLYVSVIGFLCGIMLKQSPFQLIPAPTAAELAANPTWQFPPADGMGLNPSLQNYWMTIHPPTIFFGFASLLVPFVYAIAAILWKDYEKWVPRVMPYALLSCATLGGGLFMGGYWAYETQGWHGFWAWDPVENASFFPWLAITALVHGLVVQKSRGGMARMNTLLGVLAFALFLVGTFLTRSGALAQEDANGVLLSVHAFANMESSALILMVGMLAFYGLGGLLLWAWFAPTMPGRPKQPGMPLSRDTAMWVGVWLLLIACLIITFGTTQPLFQSWFKMQPSALKQAFYNKTLVPLTLLAALFMGVAPWLAWRKTNPDTFLRKLMIPWIAMLVFGFAMVVWVQGAERGMNHSFDPAHIADVQTQQAWISPVTQRLVVIMLTATGFLAAFSNSMLAFRVFRAKPLSAGGWLAHVGIGVLIIGAVVSNTYERTERLTVVESEEPKEVFAVTDANGKKIKEGYKIAYESMTGKLMEGRPLNPDYDLNNAVQLRITPPNVERAANADGTRTFVITPRWFVHNKHRARTEQELQRMRWPHIQKYAGHDLYVGLAGDPGYAWPTDNQEGVPNEQKYLGMAFKYKEKKRIGEYIVGYYDTYGEPGKMMGAHIVIATPEGKVVEAFPALKMERGEPDKDGNPTMTMTPVNIEIKDIKDDQGRPGAIYLDKLDAASKTAILRLSLPGARGRWEVPLEVTYKPWVNLVWTGVMIAVIGTLLAMARRAWEARRVKDDDDTPPQYEAWEAPEDSIPVPVAPAGAASIVLEQPKKGAKLKPQTE